MYAWAWACGVYGNMLALAPSEAGSSPARSTLKILPKTIGGIFSLPKKFSIFSLSLALFVLLIVPTTQRAYVPIDRFKNVVDVGSRVEKLAGLDTA